MAIAPNEFDEYLYAPISSAPVAESQSSDDFSDYIYGTATESKDESTFGDAAQLGWERFKTALEVPLNKAGIVSNEELAKDVSADNALAESKTRPGYLKPIEERVKATNEAKGAGETAWEMAKLIGTAIINPKATSYLFTENLANQTASLGGIVGGAAVGAAVGGGVPGALIGMAGGALIGNSPEYGGKVVELIGAEAQRRKLDPTDPSSVLTILQDKDFRDEAERQGLVKWGIISAVDTVTGGIVGRSMSAAERTYATAQKSILAKAGLSGADNTAVKAAITANPALRAELSAARNTYLATQTLKPTVQRGALGTTAEMGSEGGGEYLGEGLASGEWKAGDATLEGILAVGQSVGTAIGTGGVFRSLSDARVATDILSAPTVDAATAAFNDVTRTPAQQLVKIDETSSALDTTNLMSAITAERQGAIDAQFPGQTTGAINTPFTPTSPALAPAPLTLEQRNDQTINSIEGLSDEQLRGSLPADTTRLPDTSPVIKGQRSLGQQALNILSTRAKSGINPTTQQADDNILGMARRDLGEPKFAELEKLATGPFQLTQDQQRSARADATSPIQIVPRKSGTNEITTQSPEQAAAVKQALIDANIPLSRTTDASIVTQKTADATVVQQIVQRVNTQFTEPRSLSPNPFPVLEDYVDAPVETQQSQPQETPNDLPPVAAPTAGQVKGLTATFQDEVNVVTENDLPALDTRVPGATMSRYRAGLIRRLTKLFGTDVVFFKPKSGIKSDGFYRGGKTLYVNVNSGKDALAVAGHEFGHALEVMFPEKYLKVTEATKALITKAGKVKEVATGYLEIAAKEDTETGRKYKAILDRVNRDWKEAGDEAHKADDIDFIAKEFSSDITGNLWRDPAQLKEVFDAIIEAHPPSIARDLIKSLGDMILNFINKVLGTVGKSAFNEFGLTREELLGLRTEIKGLMKDAFLQAEKSRVNEMRGTPVADEGAVGELREDPPRMSDEAKQMWEERGENADDRQYELGLKKGQRAKKTLATLSGDEKLRIQRDAKKYGFTAAEVEAEVRSIKLNYPASEGWVQPVFNQILEKGDNLNTRIEFKTIPYGFHIPPQWESDKAPDPHGKKAAPWVQEMANRLTTAVVDLSHRAANGDATAKSIIDHMTWYREMARRLRDEFGGFGDAFADLLGATSPNTPVRTNWNFSVDALRRFVRGEFDDKLRAYEKAIAQGMGPKAFREQFGEELLTQITGTQYGINSVNAAKALVGMWRAVKMGDAPKARNFALNLIGQSDKATIDVWAARMLQRLAKKGRIPPKAEGAVTGNHATNVENVTGQFGFGQLVFGKATEQLKAQGVNITAPDLQAIAWFMEKELWTNNGWTKGLGSEGSFENEADKMPLDRLQAGATIAEYGSTPTDQEMAQARDQMTGVLAGDPDVIAYRALPTVGMYAGDTERSFDQEILAKRGWNPAKWIASVVTVARQKNQLDTFFSRVLNPDEDHPNARPGMEVYFKSAEDMAKVKPMLDKIVAKGIDGFTLVVDPLQRRNLQEGKEASTFIGIRLQFVPEIAMRFMDPSGADYKALASGNETRVQEVMKDKRRRIMDAVDELQDVPEVAFAKHYKYDTLVIGKENYDGYSDSESGRRREVFGGEESKQSIAERLEGAASRLQKEPGREHDGHVLQWQASGPGRTTQFSEPRSDAAGRGPVRDSPRRSDGKEAVNNVTGVHYSREQRNTLLASMFGTGLKGAELERIKAAADERLRHRIYFYVNGGRGINQEQGVGSHAHQANLDNLYDLDNDPFDLAIGQDKNLVESRILDNGYDGVISNGRGVAILIGPRALPVEYLGSGVKPTTDTPEQSPQSAYGKLRAAVQANKSLPSGQMSGATWKRLMGALMPSVDVSHLEDEQSYYKDQIVGGPDIRYSTPRFISVLAQQVEAMPPKVDNTSAQNVKLWLLSNQKIKKDEIQWSGILEYLDLRASGALLGDGNPPSLKNLNDAASPYSKLLTDLFAGVSGVVHSNPLVKVPRYKPSIDSVVIEGVAIDPDSVGDLRGLVAGSGKRFGLLDIKARRLVVNAVRSSIHDDKIIRSVVKFIPVDVMNNLIGKELSSDALLDDVSMLEDALTINSNSPMPTRVDVAIESLVSNPAFHTAEIIRAFIEQGRASVSSNATVGASKLHGDLRSSKATNILPDHRRVSKQELLNYLKQGGVKIEETKLGEVPVVNDDDVAHGYEYEGYTVVESASSDMHFDIYRGDKIVKRRLTRDQTIYELNMLTEGAPRPKYAGYRLPGGVDYRELLLTLPGEDPARAGMIRRIQLIEEIALDEQRDLNEKEMGDIARIREKIAALPTSPVKGTFKSSHFDQPNVIAHLRSDTVTGSDGKRYLRIIEIQSDFGQQGEEKGFVGQKPEDEKRVAEFKQKLEKEQDAEKQAALKKSIAKIEKRIKDGTYSTPLAPLVTETKAWIALVVKRALMMAVQEGHDGIVFATGQQNADLYDLSKQVDRIHYYPVDDKYHLSVMGKNGEDLHRGTHTESELEDVVGKDIVQKIEANEGSAEGGSESFSKATKPQSIRELGDDIFGSEMNSLMPLNHVDASVLAMLKHNQVLDAVVKAIPIDVVDMLKGFNISPNNMLRNKDVISARLPVDSRGRAADGIISALRLTHATIRAKLSSVLSGGPNVELLPALFASDLNAREVAGVISPSTIFHGGAGLSNPQELTPARPRTESAALDNSLKLAPAALANLLNGHDLLLQKENKRIIKQTYIAPSSYSISGDGLKVGGSGMRAFYDQIVPSVVKDVLKKLGAGETAIAQIKIAAPAATKQSNQDDALLDDLGVKVEGKFTGRQPGFLIPDTLRAKVQTEGVPLFSTTRIVGNSGRQYTPEQQAMFKQTGRDIDVKSTLESLKEYVSKRWVQGIFDQFAPIKDINKQAYALMRLSRGASGAFEAFLKHGKLSLRDGTYDADTTGGAVDEVFVPLGKETTDFLNWIAGHRAEKLAAEGRERLFSDSDIAAAKSLSDGTTDFDYTLRNGQVTRDRTKIYADSLIKFNEFNKNVMDMAEQSGLIDGSARKLWESEFYVPFYRVMEDDNLRSMGIKKGVVRQQAFKKLTGGEEKLGDLLANTLLNWHHLIDASAKNRAAKAAIEAAEGMGIAKLVGSTMGRYASSNGAMLPPGTKGTVWFMEGGYPEVYAIDNPAVMEAVNGLQYAGLSGPLWSMLTAPKHWLTMGVTASPFFKIRNLIRDSMQAIATSDLSYNIPGNLKEGYRLTNRDRQEYVSALAGGGLIRFGTMLEGNEASRARQLIRKGAKDANMLDDQSAWGKLYTKLLEPGIEAYNELGNRGEEINRMALYEQLIKQGVDHATASLMARDLMDFSSQGSFETIRILSQIVPFFNARMQGMYKLGRATKENRAHMATVIFTAALASLALMGMAAGDEDKWAKWKKREEWDKASNWWFEFGGKTFRIPKPFELGTVSHIVERTVEGMFDSERDAGKRTAKALMDAAMNQLSMNPVPQAFKPIIDLYANYDSFTKRPIEGMAMQRLDPQERYNANTSMPARWASDVTGGALSPLQYDHLVRAYFGWVGGAAVGTADLIARGVNDEPTKPALDYWKFTSGGMAREDETASRYVTMMYDQFAELEQAHATYNRLRKEGKLDDAAEYKEDNADKLKAYRSVSGIKKQVSSLNERIRVIERSTLHPAEKRVKLRALKQQQSDLAARLSQ